MLESVKIARRQSEIRQALAELVGKEKPTDDETRSMEVMDNEYRTNETRYRAALIAEDEERREAKAELETRSDTEFAELVEKFELRQVALALDEGRPLNGATAEIVSELRDKGSYSGLPVPWAALEKRAGETLASGTPDPVATRPIIDRLFPGSVAARMGASLITVDAGSVEWPVATSGATVGWQASETGSVGAPQAYATVDRPLAPDHTLGVQMKITRKSLKQSGDALEQAVRRDMNGAMAAAMDRAVFLGSGSNGEPEGIIELSAESGDDIVSLPIDGAASWSGFRAAVTQFLIDNAASSPSAVKMLLRPEVWDSMSELIDGLDISEWDLLTRHIPASNIVLSSNALGDPEDSPSQSKAVLTTSVGGVPPIFVGAWGAIDLIRDPYTDAASGGLRLTALATMDVTFSRGEQLLVLTGIQ